MMASGHRRPRTAGSDAAPLERAQGSLALSGDDVGGIRGLPRGRHGLDESAVRRTHRNRILRSMVAVVAEEGYKAATVAQVVGRAHVSRSTFYAQFSDKEECFFAATAKGRQLMFGRVRRAVRRLPADAPDEARLRAGVRAFLEFLCDEPAFAVVFYLELPAVGRRGAERVASAHLQFAAMTAAWHAAARSRHPDWPEVPEEVFAALTGAVEQLVKEKVRSGQVGQIPMLEDLIVALHLKLLCAADW
jgi:AcrR family transcriptional regulator